MPHFRQYPMGDVVNANLEPGEYVLRRNAVNALGVDNMELLNHADGAHGNLNKLMVSADLENKLVQDNAPEKSDVNGYPIANSPVRQRVDATRQMQGGGPVEEEQAMIPAGENIFGQPTEAMTQSQMSNMLLDMMTGGVGGTIKGVGKALRGAQMEMFPKKASRALSKSRKKSKKPAKEYRETDEVPFTGTREYRDWPDIDLSYRSGDNRLAERFLEDHGYRPYMGQGSREFTYEYTDKGLKTFTPYGGVKSGIEQKTFNDPTFKVLRDWMGYQQGGPVYGYQNGGQVKSARQAAQDSLMNTDEYDDVRAEDAKQLQIMAMLDSLNQGGGENVRSPDGGGVFSNNGRSYSPSLLERFNMWEQTGQGVESARARQLEMAKVPTDNYNGEDVVKNMDSLKHYFRSFGRLKTPLQERNEFLYNRLGINPKNPPMQLQGLKGRALLQRYGNEQQ